MKFKKITYSEELIKEMKGGCEYEGQAIDFLKETKTDLNIVFSHKGRHFPEDTEKRNIYEVTIDNEKGQYSFMFGDSLHNTNQMKRKSPKAYDILTCLTTYEIDDFAEFAIEFGYELNNEEQIRNAQKTYRAVKEESRNLKKLFSANELEKLSEIQ